VRVQNNAETPEVITIKGYTRLIYHYENGYRNLSQFIGYNL